MGTGLACSTGVVVKRALVLERLLNMRGGPGMGLSLIHI